MKFALSTSVTTYLPSDILLTLLLLLFELFESDLRRDQTLLQLAQVLLELINKFMVEELFIANEDIRSIYYTALLLPIDRLIFRFYVGEVDGVIEFRRI